MNGTTDKIRHRYASRMRTRFGFEPSGAKPCPRLVAGLRCLSQDSACVCEGWPAAIIDHVAVWNTADGQKVFTSEPYDFDEADPEFERFSSALEDLGLVVDVERRGEWNDGTTLLVVKKR